MLSQRSEDLLKAIYELQQRAEEDRITTSSLARELGVVDATVTGLLKKLALHKPNLIEYWRYRGVALTEAGRMRALKLVRRHRLLETFLAQNLGYSWDEVHQEADALEHVITENFGDRIAASLKNPVTDPHGSPIPNKDGTVVMLNDLPLSRLEAGDMATISRVSDDDPDLLRYLDELGLKPQITVQMLDRGHFDDIYHIQETHTGNSHHLSRFVADKVFVTPLDEA